MRLTVLLAFLLAGCGVAPVTSVRMAARPAVMASDELQQDVVKGFRQIFTTYDNAPKDEKLSFREFGHVVTREWFQAHDANHDGTIPFDEWLTPAEMATQVADIVASGKDLVTKGDRDGDGALSQAEFLAYEAFEVDPTPWLAGPADAQIKAHAFAQHAPQGKLDMGRAASLIGDLLAQGYYLDDGSEVRRSRRPARP